MQTSTALRWILCPNLIDCICDWSVALLQAALHLPLEHYRALSELHQWRHLQSMCWKNALYGGL